MWGNFQGLSHQLSRKNTAHVACIYTFGRITSQCMHSVQEHCGLVRCPPAMIPPVGAHKKGARLQQHHVCQKQAPSKNVNRSILTIQNA